MTNRTWVIVGATSIIAIEFAKLAAGTGNNLILAGRNIEHLEIIAANVKVRFNIDFKIIEFDAENNLEPLLSYLKTSTEELDLMLVSGLTIPNDELSIESINSLIEVNVTSVCKIIFQYWQKEQHKKNLLFISSVAACRGRLKNSLYGGTKSLIEIYIEGLMQNKNSNEQITIARLGFIDTKTTYGQDGVFYAASPENCARALFNAINKKKRLIYYPGFWRLIMFSISKLPFIIFKRLSF